MDFVPLVGGMGLAFFPFAAPLAAGFASFRVVFEVGVVNSNFVADLAALGLPLIGAALDLVLTAGFAVFVLIAEVGPGEEGMVAFLLVGFCIRDGVTTFLAVALLLAASFASFCAVFEVGVVNSTFVADLAVFGSFNWSLRSLF